MKRSFRNQRTLAAPVSVSGFGYWTDQDVTVILNPAPANTGVVFVRVDLDEPVKMPADVDLRIDIPRRTCLCQGDTRVEMIEHIMASLYGLNVDNCTVCVDAVEMPGCDGSSLDIIKAIDSIGTVEQDALRQAIVVTSPVRVGNEKSWIKIDPTNSDGLSVSCRIDYGNVPSIGRQLIRMDITPETIRNEIAPARTFILEEEAAWLRKQGLANRSSYENILVFDENGPIENKLRFTDECVRHKVLDIVGDLALSGCDIVGHVTAFCNSHKLNAELVCALRRSHQAIPPLTDEVKVA